jgi:hypothetical protein
MKKPTGSTNTIPKTPQPPAQWNQLFYPVQKTARSITIDDLSADWLTTKAITDHKIPAEIISEMIRERIAISL